MTNLTAKEARELSALVDIDELRLSKILEYIKERANKGFVFVYFDDKDKDIDGYSVTDKDLLALEKLGYDYQRIPTHPGACEFKISW